MSFRVIEGGKEYASHQPGFVCTWCGFKATTREELEAHWQSPKGKRCSRNRFVNDPTQEKNNTDADPSV